MLERIGCSIGGGQHLDVEPFEQRARTEFRRLQSLRDRVVHSLCVIGVELAFDAEYLAQLVLDPRSRRSRSKKMPLIGKGLPNPSRIALGGGRRSVDRRHTE